MKKYYDHGHVLMFFNANDYVNIRLHREYSLPGILNPKLSQQFVRPFQVAKRVNNLAYQLDLPATWRIHNVLSIAHLEPAIFPNDDPYSRPRPDHPPAIIVDGESEWEIERLLAKRQSGRSSQYLVRWKGYGPEHDRWYSARQLANAKDLIQNYERHLAAVQSASSILP